MKTTYYLRNAKSAFLATCLLLCASHANADGTKDMYPQGNKGYRAAIWSSNDCKNTTNPFPTVGVMKVYAKAGEHILLGSSAIGKGEGAIGFRAPNGASESYKTKEKGRIDTRAQELAGPNYNGTITAGFTPIDIEVEDDQEGVWEIYFMSPTFSDTYNSDESTSKYSIENWSQNNNDGSIMAFDISVCDAGKTKLIPGRAFTNVLNMNVLQSPNDEKYGSCWYSNLYILTNAGYTYRVNTNGQNPHYGAFFSNNKGLQKVGTGKISTTNYIDPFSGKETGYKCYQDGEKSYKSMPSSLTETGYIYDPRMQDNRIKVANGKGDSTWKYEDVTHKIFFCQPANDLPESAKAVYGTTISDTWLKTATTEKPKMDQLSLQGKEANTNGLFGPEGMQITFSSTVAGSFRIQMDFDGEYETKIFEGTCITGINRIDWDGKDGKGKNIAFDKDLTVKLSGELTTAEVHFPFTDLENNENGFILELIDKEGNAYSDVIYWDDSEVQANEEGTDGIQSLNGSASKTGAHKWMTSNSSGNDAIIDTWSYVKVNAESSTAIPTVHFVDLAVSNVKSIAQTIKAGDEIAIQMQVENLSKSDIAYNDVTLNLTDDVEGAAVGIWVKEGGFHVTEVIVNESDDENCKVSQQPNGDVNAMGYISLQNGKKATITVKGYADETLVGKSVQPQAFIMRPGDFFEIDAENLANDGMPNDPIKEYAKENNNVVACQTITVDGGVNQKPVVSNTDTETLDVTIKGANGTSYTEDPIMLPINIFDPEKSAVTTTLSGDDAANFKVENGNIYYVGTTPASGDNVVYAITVTAKDDQEGTTVRNVNVTLLMEDASLKPCDIAVKCDTIKYGQTIETAIAKMTTADTTATGEANGTWMIRSNDQSEVNTSDVPDAGVYELTFSYYTDLNSDYESETITKEVVVLPRTVTLTSGSAEKEYDGTAVSNESIEVSGDGFYGSENVVASNFATLQNVGEKENDFDISFSNGAKETNYNIVKKPGTLKVTPKELFVTGVKVNDKNFDGSNKAEIKEMGLLNGVIEGDEVEIESATAQFISEEIGTDSAVVSFTLKGADAFNYIVKEATVKATILNGDETDDENNWIVANPTLPYGEATVGVTEKATPNDPSEKAVITYTVDGEAANEGDIIPAGEHTIQVVYNDPENGKTIDTTFTCIVTKRPISIEGAKSEPKVFDGNTQAKLSDKGTLTGVLKGDEVEIAQAQPIFETPNVGTNKNVSIQYTLTGKDLSNYEFTGNPIIINDGVITKANQSAPAVSSAINTGVEGGKISGLTDEMEISQDGITWTPVTDANATLPEGNYWVRYAETENANASSPTQVSVASGVINMVDAENFIVDVNGYCPESEGDIMFQVIAGNPTEFRASIVGISEKKLENTAYQYLSEENKFSVYIPMCDAGSYTIQVQFRNEAGSVSPVYNFPIDVNLAAKYINNIWEDVVSIINKNTPELDSKDFEKRFVEFQWYRDNEKIEGATMPYYNEKGGLNGVYYASVTTADNRHLRTCTREWHFTYGLTINVYPNPVVDKANVTLSIDNGEEHELVVTDMSGINIYRGLFTGDNTTIDCSSYGNGWYVIRVDNAQIKIIKE